MEKSAPQEIISCENLVKIYLRADIEVFALQGLDLHVMLGEMIGIVGESGSGKTTLLNVLGGLDQPTAGKVSVAGQSLIKLNEFELNKYRTHQVGFIWQQTARNLIPYLNARENVELPMGLTDFPYAKRKSGARELLNMVGLSKRDGHLPAELSGGEQQRVGIAVALANNPSILLADEPTGEVDVTTAQEIYSALKSVNQNLGTTLLIVSHDPALERHVDRVVAIRDGKTSTEIMRLPLEESHTFTGSQEGDLGSLQEMLVLDSVGRVQIPREVLKALDIGDRVRLVVKGKTVMLEPVEGHRSATSQEKHAESEISFLAEEPLTELQNTTWWEYVRRRIKQRWQ